MRAKPAGSHRHVAIKVMHPESQADGDNVRRFVNEVLAAAKVRHPTWSRCSTRASTRITGSVGSSFELLTGIDLATYLLATRSRCRARPSPWSVRCSRP